MRPLSAADAQSEGRDLASELRNARPPQDLTNRAALRVRDPDGRRSATPISLETRLSADGGWDAVYATAGETLVIRHRPDQPPEYRIGPGRDLKVASAAEAARPFAGSDFWPCDLGLEFLHWPDQKLIRRDKPEMRKGRPCRLLESSDPHAPGYVRVRSWIDAEQGQPIMAEAYDKDGRLVKTFSVGSVEKVDGVWRLKDLEMTDERRGSRTRLEFEYRAAELNPR